jgi:hypothetical protein
MLSATLRTEIIVPYVMSAALTSVITAPFAAAIARVADGSHGPSGLALPGFETA